MSWYIYLGWVNFVKKKKKKKTENINNLKLVMGREDQRLKLIFYSQRIDSKRETMLSKASLVCASICNIF